MGIHPFFAKLAFSTGGDTGYDDMIAFFEVAYGATDLFYDPYSFMS
jgi:hypothetical protein